MTKPQILMTPQAAGIVCLTPCHMATHPKPWLLCKPGGRARLPPSPRTLLCVTQVSVSAPAGSQPCPRFTTALTWALWLTPQGRGQTEQIESSQYLVGVEGLEAGLGRAVKGAGDTESVVQNLQLRQ